MAEILREDQLNEKREKARNEDMKLHDAKLRRMFQAAQAVAVRKERLVFIHIYSKTCVKRPLKKKDKTNILMTNGSLMKVESIAECSPWVDSIGFLFYCTTVGQASDLMMALM